MNSSKTSGGTEQTSNKQPATKQVEVEDKDKVEDKKKNFILKKLRQSVINSHH
jgi:hypothetical protein